MRDRVRRDGSRFGLRVIREGGRVRWLGRWYVLESGPLSLTEYEAIQSLSERAERKNCPTYDGRMDGRRGLFYSYGDYDRRAANGDAALHLHSVDDEWPGPACIGGVFHWERFMPEAA